MERTRCTLDALDTGAQRARTHKCARVPLERVLHLPGQPCVRWCGSRAPRAPDSSFCRSRGKMVRRAGAVLVVMSAFLCLIGCEADAPLIARSEEPMLYVILTPDTLTPSGRPLTAL